MFLRYPDSLRPTFQRLKDRLDDAEPSVQSCSVNVICELARKNPKNYLSLAPIFFRLLTTSQNNWMRIKIIKLFAALTPLEPRLAKKLIEPLTSLIHQTPAMSLLYECINTVIISVPDHLPSIQLCVTKLRIFIEDQDQNLKYLGLQALARVLKIAPKAVAAHKDLIIGCLDDQDESIRYRALALIGGMCNKKNLQDIVAKLASHLDTIDGLTYRDVVVEKIVEVCAAENYKFITDFGWYLDVLIKLTHVEGTKHGKLIGAQLMDVSIRVKVVRAAACKQLVTLLDSPHLLQSNNEKHGVCEVLYAAAYCAGEFAELIEDPATVIDCLLQQRVSGLPGHIQAVFVHNACKIYGESTKRTEPDNEEGQAKLKELRARMLEQLMFFENASDLEVQERAVSAIALIKYVSKQRDKGVNIDEEVVGLFGGELKPVAPKAQRSKVLIPADLDLDKWIHSPPKEPEAKKDAEMFGWLEPSLLEDDLFKRESDDEETKEVKRTAKKTANEANPFHLGAGAVKSRPTSDDEKDGDEDMVSQEDVDAIPVKTLSLGLGSIMISATKKKKKKKLTKKEIKRLKKKGLPIPNQDDEPDEPVEIETGLDMPEGYVASDDEDNEAKEDVFRALDINLDQPLDDNEFALPTATHHVAQSLTEIEAAVLEKKRLKKEKKAKKKAGKEDKEGGGKKKKKDKKDKKGKDTDEAAAPAVETEPAATPNVVEDDGPMDTPEGADALDDFLTESAPKPASPDDSKKKKKKDKKEKKKDKKDKKKKKGDAPVEAPVIVSFPASQYRALASDDNLAITFDTLAGAAESQQIQVSYIINNKSANKVTGLALVVTDSDAAKLSREEGSEGEIAIPFELEAGGTNDYRFAVDVTSTSPTTALSGGIKYSVRDATVLFSLSLFLSLSLSLSLSHTHTRARAVCVLVCVFHTFIIRNR